MELYLRQISPHDFDFGLVVKMRRYPQKNKVHAQVFFLFCPAFFLRENISRPAQKNISMTDNHGLLYVLSLFKQRYTRGDVMDADRAQLRYHPRKRETVPGLLHHPLRDDLAMVIALAVPLYRYL